MQHKRFISTPEAAKLLGISRVAVFNRIKRGEIPAKKVGRNFVIEKSAIVRGKDAELTNREKQVIDKAVDHTVKDYGVTLKKLADA